MDRVIGISYGELALKGGNRSFFENKLLNHLKVATRDFGKPRVYRDMSKVFIEVNDDNIDQIVDKVKKVFGIVQISQCVRINKDMELLKKESVNVVNKVLDNKNVNTFKVAVKRNDKKFQHNSMEIARELGGIILENTDNLSVNVKNPDLYVYVEIRDDIYIYTEKIKTYGGLPIGTNGSALLLLSGGIDSPVAGFMIAKRGVIINAVHFHSYPFTSERAEEKVKNLAKKLTEYCGNFNIFSVNLLNIQKEINKKCPEDEMTIISRRFMMRIAEKIAIKGNMDALITGESLGQVASQTIKGLNVTNASVNLPVFRPLIGMDKTDIIEIAQEIDTFETSILPYEDCCTVFLPKRPVTKPRLERIEQSEEALDVDGLVESAIENMEIIKIKYE